MRNRASDRRIPRSDALTLNHRDFTVSEVYYEVYMTRVLYTARIRNFDSVMFLNRVRELVSIELGKEMLSIFCSPRKSSSCECHSDGYAGYFLELPGRYQSSRELKIQFHAGGVIWSLGRRQERTARVTWIPQISFFQFMKSVKKGSQSFPPTELRRPRCIERWKLLCSKKKIRTCCLSCHFIKVPRRRRRTTPFPVKTLNQFLPKTHHEFLPIRVRAKQDKTNTEAIDISIHSNESPSIVSTVRLSFSQVRPNR